MRTIRFLVLVSALLLVLPLFSSGQNEAAAQTASSRTFLQDMFGDSLVTADYESVSLSELDGEKIGIYFSASWCPPCRTFTPELVKAYNEMQDQGKAFKLVFVTADRTEADMRAYMKDYEMPWYALEFGSPEIRNLVGHFAVSGIPYLVILDAEGNIVSVNGRMEIMEHGAAAFDLW